MFDILVAGARETEQMAPTFGRDGLHIGVLSTPPTPALKVGGHMLLCTLTDLRREIELPSVAPGTCEPEKDGKYVFIIVHGTSNATHPVDIDDKTRPKEPRARDGETLRVALGESGRMSRDSK